MCFSLEISKVNRAGGFKPLKIIYMHGVKSICKYKINIFHLPEILTLSPKL